ncbi:MAG: hypothetical protein PHR45_05010 [Muribaculaceae bacterium]|nr:hypothetical protein [Muribaculaceae bacterium]
MTKSDLKQFLSQFSFRTGIIIMICCIPCYIFSFAQIMLPISATTKWILWVVFFGLAKTFQYTGITIIGVEGVKRIKRFWNKKKNESA